MAPPKSLETCQRLNLAGCRRGRPALDVGEVSCSNGAAGWLVTVVLKVKRLGRPQGERCEMGDGPTRSTCTCWKIWSGIWICSGWVLMCTCTWARAHPTQSRHHWVMSATQLFQMNQLENNLRVARTPGWASSCTAANTTFCMHMGTIGLTAPDNTSHSSFTPSTSSSCTCREEPAAVFRRTWLGHMPAAPDPLSLVSAAPRRLLGGTGHPPQHCPCLLHA
jgi:hypothetical protein